MVDSCGPNAAAREAAHGDTLRLDRRATSGMPSGRRLAARAFRPAFRVAVLRRRLGGPFKGLLGTPEHRFF